MAILLSGRCLALRGWSFLVVLVCFSGVFLCGVVRRGSRGICMLCLTCLLCSLGRVLFRLCRSRVWGIFIRSFVVHKGAWFMRVVFLIGPWLLRASSVALSV